MSSQSSDRDVLDGGFRFPVGIFLVSMLAFPICKILSITSAMDDSRLVFLVGLVVCLGMAPLTYLGVVHGTPAGRDIFFYVFSIFSFTSLVDLILAFTIAGTQLDWMAFYLREGEVYLRTAHGLWINAWDGTYHYICYLLLTALMLRKSHSYSNPLFRTVGLFWSGSILNSMIVLFAGSALGRHADHIKPSYLLNIPYALFPGIFVWRVIHARSAPPASLSTPKRRWFWDLLLLAAFYLSTAICILRCLVVLRSRLPFAHFYGENIEAHLLDSSGYPTIQMVTYAYYLLPYFVYAGSSLLFGDLHNPAFIDWTKFCLGGVLQGTFSYVLAALHQGSAYYTNKHIYQSTTNQDAFFWFVFINSFLLLTMIATLIRSLMDQETSIGRDHTSSGSSGRRGTRLDSRRNDHLHET